MSNQNLYANKIYADNPTALWTLDDTPITGTPVSLSSSTGLSLYGVASNSYGFDNNPAYYICTTSNINSILSENFGAPMVYGASNITNLFNGSTNPSLIIPGYGFMHELGKYKKMTVEMWLRITSSTQTEKRIFGPIGTTDGLYVHGSFLSLKVGNSVGSYYVGEWQRPMLIHISYNDEAVTLMVNGETVLKVEFDITLTNFSSLSTKNWLGFYAYDVIPLIQIDCIAIYPYNISQKHAKLHMIHAQSVDNPKQKNTSYFDVPITIDYSLSKSANNHNYPDHSKWRDGIAINLSTSNNRLSFDLGNKPTLIFQNKELTQADWNITNQVNNIKAADGSGLYFRMKPQEYDKNNNNALISSAYWNSEGYFLTSSFNVPGFITSGLYLTAMADRGTELVDDVSTPLTPETLIKIVDKKKNSFTIQVEYPSSGTSRTITYKYNNSTIYTTTTTNSSVFSVGIDINKIIQDNLTIEGLSTFFSNKDSLSISFGGSGLFDDTFSGKIYSFGLFSQLDLNNLTSSEIDLTTGIIELTATSFIDYVGSYSVKPTNTYDVFDIDISANGSWSDIIAGSVLAKQILDEDDNKKYDLDFIQLNIDYPEYSSTTSCAVRTYVRFLQISNTQLMEAAATNVAVQSNGIITPDSGWINKRYEFINGNILYYPSGQDINLLSIKIEIEVTAKDILRNPIRIKTLQTSSRAFNKNSGAVKNIGTKFGKDIVSFGSSAPFKIYKKSTPYFYLSKDSGIKLLGSTFNNTKGISIPLNKNLASFYQTSVIQFAAMYEGSFTNGTSYPILNVVTPNRTIVVSATGTTGNKATLSVTDATVLINGQSSVSFRPGQWNIFTINFNPLIDLNNVEGSIQIIGNFIVNNVSDHQIAEIKQIQSISYTTWDAYDTEITWDQVDGVTNNTINSGVTWKQDVLKPVISVAGTIGLNSETIYKEYTGNNILSADTGDETAITFGVNKWKVYNGTQYQSLTSTPL